MQYHLQAEQLVWKRNTATCHYFCFGSDCIQFRVFSSPFSDMEVIQHIMSRMEPFSFSWISQSDAWCHLWTNGNLCQIPQQNRRPAGQSEWKCGQNELRDFEDQTIVALASTEGGNKDTLVPEGIKYGGIYTKRPNRMLRHSSSALKPEYCQTELSEQTCSSTEHFREVFFAASLCKEMTDELRKW